MRSGWRIVLRCWSLPALVATSAGLGIGAARLLRLAVVRRFGAPAERRGTRRCSGTDVEDVRFDGPAGSTLRGLVLRTTGASGTAVVVHGWGGSASDLLPIGRVLADLGLDVLLVDARGHGRSDPAEVTSMPHFAQDVHAAVRWWRASGDLCQDRLLLVGHSVGAGACLLVARDEPLVGGVVLLASMAHPRRTMHRLLVDAGTPRPLTRPALRAVEHLIGWRFDEFAPVRVLPVVDVPVLIVHGDRDVTVPVGDARQLAAVAPDGELVVLPGAGHNDIDALPAVRAGLLRLLARIPASL